MQRTESIIHCRVMHDNDIKMAERSVNQLSNVTIQTQ